MKNKKFLASLFLAIFSVFVLISCKANQYIVSFDVNGGSAIESVVTTDGVVVKPNDPTKEGYTFGGWYEDEEFTNPFDFTTEKVNANTTLYAKWNEILVYTISFDSNGGSTIADQEVSEGNTVTKPVNPIRTGYTFIGWYTDNQFSTLYDFGQKVSGNFTLYAKWDVDYYTISFNTNGGSSVASQQVEPGKKVTKPVDPIKDGYTFGGWFSDEALTNSFDFTTSINGNLVLYAKWNEGSSDIKVYTITEIIAMCANYQDAASTERFYVQGEVVEITDPNYGEMIIKDSTGSISVFGTYGADGEDRYSDLTDKPVKGDTVLLYATIQSYKGEAEIHSGWIIEFTHNEPTFDINDYETLSISQAREKEAGSLVLLEGVVAAYTYNANMNPIGFILIDSTSSIYVYDSQIAPQVKVGNKIKIAGERDNWILESEQSFATKFSYDGCIQIANCYLIENDNQTTNNWDKTWVTESTVKTLIDTDVKEENITSKLYKVNALVKEKPGSGFTNFYFYDIDETTGTYAYTQAGGDDFTWLREFDGKVCTVYLMVLNYKSSASGVVARFLPIEVIDENYSFDLGQTAQMVLDYYVKDQFVMDSYYANPELELVTSVTNSTLGFSNVKVEYTSNNAAINFVAKDGKCVMNVDASKDVDVVITATVTYEAQVVSWNKTIKVRTLESFNYTDIATAIAKPFDTEVTIRGIVGPSLVNRNGFYLIDETGMVAVTTTEATLATLHIGDEVILKGNHVQFRKDTTTVFGQRVIQDSEILANLYGNNQYSTKNFITDKDLTYVANLDANEDHSTEVYVVKATVNVIETPFYTNLNLTYNGTTFELYSANSNQYSWLFDYKGQEVTLGIVPCNWNDKKFYKGCVLFVQLADGTIINNTLNFS